MNGVEIMRELPRSFLILCEQTHAKRFSTHALDQTGSGMALHALADGFPSDNNRVRGALLQFAFEPLASYHPLKDLQSSTGVEDARHRCPSVPLSGTGQLKTAAPHCQGRRSIDARLFRGVYVSSLWQWDLTICRLRECSSTPMTGSPMDLC